MITINIDGEIGWEIDAAFVREKLAEAKPGEDVMVNIASPGGLISEGLKIYNELKNYPGTVNTHLDGVVASMATYIAMVGEHRTAEKNAIFMIHNGRMLAIGDHRTMFKAGNHLNSLSNMIAKEYAEKSGAALVDIRAAMDEETFYYGDEIKDAGFVHEMTGEQEGGAEGKAEAVAIAEALVADALAKMNTPDMVKKDFDALAKMMADTSGGQDTDDTLPEMKINGFDSSAALVDEPWSKSESETRWRKHVGVEGRDDLPNAKYDKRFIYVDDPNSLTARNFPVWDFKGGKEFVNISAVRNGLARLSQSSIPETDKGKVEAVLNKYLDKFNKQKEQEGSKMTYEELKEQHPELFARIYGEGKSAGAEDERNRVKSLTEMRAKFTKEGSQKVIDQAIAEGHDMSKLTINLMAAEQASGELEDEEDNDTDTGAGADGDDGGDDDAPEMKDGVMTHPKHIEQVSSKIAGVVGLKTGTEN